jgi:nitroimidazol reductase NimA-like FMN-containing flavoprotein (pyridoxamine 5'-phosphate oxidase superfamily)
VDALALDELQKRSFDGASAATNSAYPPESRVPGVLLDRLLRARKYIVVATTRRNGTPHAAMSSFALADGKVWLPTEAGTARIRNLRRNPHASLVLTEGEDETHAVVLMDGPVTLVPDADAPASSRAAWKNKFSHEPGWAKHWICVEPRRLFSYAASRWSLVE